MTDSGNSRIHGTWDARNGGLLLATIFAVTAGGLGCSSGDSPATTGTDDSGIASDSSPAVDSGTPVDTGPPPGIPTGPGDGTWKQAFNGSGVGVTCEMTYDTMVASGAPSITSGETTLFVGFQQFGMNQDPVFFRFDNKVKVYCEHHEKESPDSRALGITWDGGPIAWVVYTTTGGGTAFDGLTKGSWIDRYGDGGGSSKVAVIGQVETKFGTVQKATFVPAKKSGNKTNSLAPAAAIRVLTDGSLEFSGNSAWAPLNPDRSGMCVPTTEYPAALDGAKGPSYVARFATDLKTMTCASTAGCSMVKQPCK